MAESYEINLEIQGGEQPEIVMEAEGGATDGASARNAEAWAVGKRNGEDVPSTDPTYHNNAKYYATDAAGSAAEAASSAAEAAQYTPEAVHTWLEENIDPDSGYALDRTLSEKLEAAPADMVGDLKNALFYTQNTIEGIATESIANEYANASSMDSVGNSNIYFLANPVPVGSYVSGFKWYAKTAGSIKYYICTIEGTTAKAVYTGVSTANATGEVLVAFDNVIKATDKPLYLGVRNESTTGILVFKNVGTSTDYGTRNTTIVEATSDTGITTDGVTVTKTTGYAFAYGIEYKYYTFIEQDLLNRVEDIITLNTKSINYFNHESIFAKIANTNAYFLDTPIENGAIVSGFDIKMEAGTINYYFVNIDANNNAIAYNSGSFAAATGGIYHVDITPFKTSGITYLGIQGASNNVLNFKSTTDATYGKKNTTIIECSDTTNISTTGATVTKTSASFVYAVDISVIQLTESNQQDDGISYNLDCGNILRYKKTEGTIGLIGRWFDYTTGGNTYKATNNEGSELYAKTKGATSATFTFGQITAQAVTPYIAYSIDGGDFTRVQISPAVTISLTNTAENDEHIIRIVIDGVTESETGINKWDGTLGIYLISAAVNSGSIVGLIPKNRQGMFFGDSITEGINALGTGANASKNSATGAFPFFCCKKLGAVSFRVGYGATGFNQVGSFNTCINAVNYLKDGLKVDTYYPDFIVINHGHNDSLSASNFKTAYETVIKRLNILYPGVPVFMVSPFSRTTYDAKMQELEASYPQCYFVSTTGWNGETTDGTHLSVNGAKNNGNLLAEEILKVLGKEFFMN